MQPKKLASFKQDGRRKYRHWQVKLFYTDGGTFGRTYTDRNKAVGFADRQKRSPLVKMARVSQIS